MKTITTFVLFVVSTSSFASERADFTHREPTNIKPQVEAPSIKPAKALPTTLPSEQKEEKIIYTPEYLQEHPEKLESMLMTLIQTLNTEGLKLLLPIYEQVPNRDESVIQWGTAIILAEEGKKDEAIHLLRQINAALPQLKLLRFQMAVLLFSDGQYEAAESEFKKLQKEKLNSSDAETLDQYIEAIRSRDNWSFGGTLSFLHDKNLNNSPPVGTTLEVESGEGVAIYNQPHESGNGVNYFFSADKKWSLSDHLFTAAHLNTYGSVYFNNSPYNDLGVRIGWGWGYRTPKGEIELMPFVSSRWYGGGSGGDGSLHTYSRTYGLHMDITRQLSPRWMYQGALEYGYDKYTQAYSHIDGGTYIISNSLSFAPSQNQYWYAGLDYMRKMAKSSNNAYKRTGVRAGWGQEWPKGISTRLSFGIAKKDYEDVDFFNIRQSNKEYDAKVSFWHRAIYFWGITPRVVLSHNRVNSNHPFYSYKKSNIYMDFSKSF